MYFREIVDADPPDWQTPPEPDDYGIVACVWLDKTCAVSWPISTVDTGFDWHQPFVCTSIVRMDGEVAMDTDILEPIDESAGAGEAREGEAAEAQTDGRQ